jgi:hypothetical protein
VEILRNNLDRLLNQFNGSIMVLDKATADLILAFSNLEGISSFVFRDKATARTFKRRNPSLVVFEPAINGSDLLEVPPQKSTISRLLQKMYRKKSA